MNQKKYHDDCNHKFSSLGFDIFKTTDKKIEAVAAIFCEKCGLFRTKILTFRREFKSEPPI